jgi:hypothetical protein
MPDTVTDVSPQDKEKPKLNEKQVKFLQELAKSAGAKLKEAQKNAQQRALINQVTGELESKTQEIKSGQTFVLMEKNSGVIGALYTMTGQAKTISSFDDDGDANKEFETGNSVLSRFNELPPDVLKAVMNAQAQIIELENKLKNRPYQPDRGSVGMRQMGFRD